MPARLPRGAASLLFDLSFVLNPGESSTIWRDQATNPWERYKAEAMGPAGTFQLPSCPEVLVLGKGELRDHWGLSCELGGARRAYGNESGSQVMSNE